MTLDRQPSTFSDETESSKPWTSVVTLGKRIVKELDLEDSVDTLGRWMAHRIAELMEQAEQAPTEAEREAAKRECTDIIIRLWEHRTKFPFKPPLADIAKFLKNLMSDPSPSLWEKPEPPDGTWSRILPHLEKLQDREYWICHQAAIAETSLEKEREWLKEHHQEMSDDECQIIESLLKLREQMDGDDYSLDSIRTPNFASLPAEERTRQILEDLKRIHTERQSLLLSVKPKLSADYEESTDSTKADYESQ